MAKNMFVAKYLLFNSDNDGDIGGASDNRPANIYAATQIQSPEFNIVSEIGSEQPWKFFNEVDELIIESQEANQNAQITIRDKDYDGTEVCQLKLDNGDPKPVILGNLKDQYGYLGTVGNKSLKLQAWGITQINLGQNYIEFYHDITPPATGGAYDVGRSATNLKWTDLWMQGVAHIGSGSENGLEISNGLLKQANDASGAGDSLTIEGANAFITSAAAGGDIILKPGLGDGAGADGVIDCSNKVVSNVANLEIDNGLEHSYEIRPYADDGLTWNDALEFINTSTGTPHTNLILSAANDGDLAGMHVKNASTSAGFFVQNQTNYTEVANRFGNGLILGTLPAKPIKFQISSLDVAKFDGSGDFLPVGSRDIGSNAAKWTDLYLSGIAYVDTKVVTPIVEAPLSSSLSLDPQDTYKTVEIGNNFASQEAAVQTIDATVTDLWSLDLAADEVYVIEAMVTSRKSDGSAQGVFKKIVCAIDTAGVASLDSPGVTTLYQSDVPAGWNVDFAVSGGNIKLQVTGAAATTINWKGHVSYKHTA